MGATVENVPPRVASSAQAGTDRAITAMPPPRGTGRSWLERALGRSMTSRATSQASTMRVPAQEARPESSAAIRVSVSIPGL